MSGFANRARSRGVWRARLESRHQLRPPRRRQGRQPAHGGPRSRPTRLKRGAGPTRRCVTCTATCTRSSSRAAPSAQRAARHRRAARRRTLPTACSRRAPSRSGTSPRRATDCIQRLARYAKARSEPTQTRGRRVGQASRINTLSPWAGVRPRQAGRLPARLRHRERPERLLLVSRAAAARVRHALPDRAPAAARRLAVARPRHRSNPHPNP